MKESFHKWYIITYLVFHFMDFDVVVSAFFSTSEDLFSSNTPHFQMFLKAVVKNNNFSTLCTTTGPSQSIRKLVRVDSIYSETAEHYG